VIASTNFESEVVLEDGGFKSMECSGCTINYAQKTIFLF